MSLYTSQQMFNMIYLDISCEKLAMYFPKINVVDYLKVFRYLSQQNLKYEPDLNVINIYQIML